MFEDSHPSQRFIGSKVIVFWDGEGQAIQSADFALNVKLHQLFYQKPYKPLVTHEIMVFRPYYQDSLVQERFDQLLEAYEQGLKKVA